MTTSMWNFQYPDVVYPIAAGLSVQYHIIPSLTVESTFVRRHDKSLVVHLLEPAMKRCFNPIRPGLFSRSPGLGGAQRPRCQKSRLTSTN